MKMDFAEPSSSASPNRWQGTPPTVTRRILDLLSYLARHQNSKVAEGFLELQVALSDESIKPQGQMAAGKLPAVEQKKTCGALEVLLKMLGQPLCQRSVSTLEQNLHLLEVVMQCATTKVASPEQPAASTKADESRTENQNQAEAGNMVSWIGLYNCTKCW